MPQPDIFMKRDRIRVVGDGGGGGVDLEVAAGEGDAASVTVDANAGDLVVGGGDGADTEGDIKVRDAGGDARVQISAGSESLSERRADRVWIDGEDAAIELGEGFYSEVTISANPGGGFDSVVTLGPPVLENPVGRAGGVGTGTEVDWGAAMLATIREQSGPAGIARFEPHGRSETSVEVRGDQAALALGYSVPESDSLLGGPVTTDVGPFDVPTGDGDGVVAGENGKILFDDGKGWKPQLVAEDGKLKFLGESSDGSTEEFLVIDADSRTIRTPWTVQEGGSSKGN